MSLKDLKLEFSDKQAVTGTSADSTKTLDLGLETNNLSGNVHGGGYLNVQCCTNAEPYGTKASGTLTFSSNATATKTIQIDTDVAQFVSGTPGEGEIKIGTTIAETIANVLAYDFGENVVLKQTDDNEITITATDTGTDGNSIILYSTDSNITASDSKLSGGTAANAVTVKLQDSDNGTDFTDVVGGAVTFTDTVAGSQGCIRLPVLKRYVKVAYGATRSLTDGKWDAYIGAPIAKH